MSANTFLAPSPVVPGMLLISNISNTYPAIITVVDSIYNTYVVNQLIKLSVPASYGMVEADNKTTEITEVNGLDFTVSMNATQFSSFTIPDPNARPTPSQYATLSPAGSKNIYNNTAAPFHSLSNTGN